jgi:anaerobic dimethyl sulfoxide reductase subunit C (anchor subunit)
MTLRDWALITFTILVQMSVGSFLVLGVVHFYATRKAGMEEADRMSDRALLAIVPVLVLAFGAPLG